MRLAQCEVLAQCLPVVVSSSPKKWYLDLEPRRPLPLRRQSLIDGKWQFCMWRSLWLSQKWIERFTETVSLLPLLVRLFICLFAVTECKVEYSLIILGCKHAKHCNALRPLGVEQYICTVWACDLRWFGGVTVRTLDLWSRGREFNSRSGRYQVVTILGWVTVCGQENHLGI